MLLRIRRAYYWLKAKDHSRKGELKAALLNLERAEALGLMKALGKAFKATIYLRQHRFDEAIALFDEVAAEKDPPQRNEDRYINLFARSIRAAIDGNSVLEQHLLRQAAAVQCRPALRRWLPIDEPWPAA